MPYERRRRALKTFCVVCHDHVFNHCDELGSFWGVVIAMCSLFTHLKGLFLQTHFPNYCKGYVLSCESPLCLRDLAIWHTSCMFLPTSRLRPKECIHSHAEIMMKCLPGKVSFASKMKLDLRINLIGITLCLLILELQSFT